MLILGKDLLLISKWAYHWKMLFNPDPIKPAQEVLFLRKKQVQTHPVLIINKIQFERLPYQKHLGNILDEDTILSNILITLFRKLIKTYLC